MRLKLSTTLKNKTSSLARDPRLLNSVVDSKGRVQKRPSLVASFGPVTLGNGLGLFVRNTPIGPGAPVPELIAITGSSLTAGPITYDPDNYILVATLSSGEAEAGFGADFAGSSINPATYGGNTIVILSAFIPPNDPQTTFRLNNASLPQNYFTSITVGSTTLLSADASYGTGTWTWNSRLISAIGTYTVIFA